MRHELTREASRSIREASRSARRLRGAFRRLRRVFGRSSHPGGFPNLPKVLPIQMVSPHRGEESPSRLFSQHTESSASRGVRLKSQSRWFPLVGSHLGKKFKVSSLQDFKISRFEKFKISRFQGLELSSCHDFKQGQQRGVFGLGAI